MPLHKTPSGEVIVRYRTLSVCVFQQTLRSEMETDATHLDFGSAQSLTIVRSVDSDGATHRVKWYGALAVPVRVGSSDL